ncbi:hypothetical protein D3C73_1458370 [compost metagenome]
MIAEAEQIQLKRFTLNHKDIRNIADVDRRKIRLTCYRTQAGEFRTIEFYKIIAVRMLVLEAFQHFRRICHRVLHPLISEQCYIFHFVCLSSCHFFSPEF